MSADDHDIERAADSILAVAIEESGPPQSSNEQRANVVRMLPHYKDQVHSIAQHPLTEENSQQESDNDTSNEMKAQTQLTDATAGTHEDEESSNEITPYPGAVTVPQVAPRFKDQIRSVIGDDSASDQIDQNSISTVSDCFTNQSSRKLHHVILHRDAVPMEHPAETAVDNSNSNNNEDPPSFNPVQAVAIHDSGEAPLVDAVVVPSRISKESVESRSKSNSWIRVWILSFVIGTIVIGATLGIVCGGTNACGSPPAPSFPTMAPTPAPTSFPTWSPDHFKERAEAIVVDINAITLSGLNLTYPPTGTEPEELALAWLIDDSTFPVNYTADRLRLRDRYALATFYNNVRGTLINWTSWKIRDHCEWKGVECEENRVVKLVVNDTKLSEDEIGKEIPRDIGLLTNLRSLQILEVDLGSGAIIPSTVTELVALTHLEIYDSNMNWGIPSGISKLSLLEHLSLTRNDLFGKIPSSLGLLTKLTCLKLNSNQFEGFLPTEVGLLTQITELRLNHNKLSGTLPSSIAALRNLKELGIYQNRFTGEIPVDLVELPLLEAGYFQDNGFVGVMPFCEVNNSTGILETLIADCRHVECTCCSHCCPSKLDGIPTSRLCGIGGFEE